MDFSRCALLYLLIMEANPKSVHTDPVNYTMTNIVYSQIDMNPTIISLLTQFPLLELLGLARGRARGVHMLPYVQHLIQPPESSSEVPKYSS